jgi:hypothetical protein
MFRRLTTLLVLLVATTVGGPFGAATTVAQDQGTPDGPQELVVWEAAPMYSETGDEVGEVSPGDRYTVLAVEDGAALVVGGDEDSEPFWIDLDARVELVKPPAAEVPPTPPPSAITTSTPTPQVVPVPVAASPTTVATALPTPPAPPSAVPSSDPASWSLTLDDLPPGLSLASSDRSETADETTYIAVFNRSESLFGRQGPFGVFNELAALRLPAGVTLRQELVDQIGDDLEFSAFLATEAGQVNTDVRTGPTTRVDGPAMGDLYRWHRVPVTVSSGGFTVRMETHLVIFTVGRNLAVVATLNVEGAGSQADAAALARIVMQRMPR